MSKPLFEAKGLTKRYGERRDLEVLSQLDLQVAAGEAVAILGQSGVGKSTLLHVLGSLDRPSAGTVLFDGADLFAMGEREQAALRNRELGFVFQFHHLLPDFTALENVMMPAFIAGKTAAEAESLAQGVLEQVGLAHRLTHKPGELSGGEQQRVALARAIVLSPRAVLADEPTGNLDPTTSAEVFQLLLGLRRERGMTLVVVTHNHEFARLLDRSLLLQGGQLSEVPR